MASRKKQEQELNPDLVERERRMRLRGIDPHEVRRVQTDERMWTKVESAVPGVTALRRMTNEEVERFKAAKDKKRVKVQPIDIQGDIP